jgi:predicted metal-dependent hydrolase
MSETLQIADLEFEVRRSSRRKTLGLTVDRAGELVVHAPDAASEDDLRRWVGRKLLWVHQKLALKEKLAGASREPEFVSGESIFYLGRNYRLRLVETQDAPLRFDGHWFLLRQKDRVDAPQHFRGWYSATGTQWLRKRVAAWESRTGASPLRIVLSDLGFRWGSCGKNHVLHFNWRLLQLPVRLVDYVIVHELVHLNERGHSPAFWKALDRVLPDWRERRSELDSSWLSQGIFRVATGHCGASD